MVHGCTPCARLTLLCVGSSGASRVEILADGSPCGFVTLRASVDDISETYRRHLENPIPHVRAYAAPPPSVLPCNTAHVAAPVCPVHAAVAALLQGARTPRPDAVFRPGAVSHTQWGAGRALVHPVTPPAAVLRCGGRRYLKAQVMGTTLETHLGKNSETEPGTGTHHSRQHLPRYAWLAADVGSGGRGPCD